MSLKTINYKYNGYNIYKYNYIEQFNLLYMDKNVFNYIMKTF